ncbi:MAG: hypothetical protein LKJ44_07945 [Bifidobacteriaceae bacterium]|jgi:hypothetical protein|nr:hypothetical protein [Bifidobacteriaceae bacterium]MCI1979616.1 hypothetical protein [Bifidobacteriaceae bacterium]
MKKYFYSSPSALKVGSIMALLTVEGKSFAELPNGKRSEQRIQTTNATMQNAPDLHRAVPDA